ncbi:MAG: efflux RND transporter periplasmic adaptor subunit [Opitutae bacterium]|nr:efflux RND transporter periplasmic adaptor subunit [Opitutae bacterium]
MKHTLPPSAIVEALCAVALLAGCGRSPAPADAPAKPALTVEVVSPTIADWPERIEAHGSIAPWQESIVGAEVGDVRLEEVLVNVGDVVTKGELLARFDSGLLAADLAVAEAAVAQAEALSVRATDKAARARRLGNTGGMSEGDLRQNEADEKAGEAQLASARAQLQLQRLRLLHAEVRAPDDGVISSRSATVGAVSGPGAELFRLIRQRRLEWRALVPADQLARVVRGQSATLESAGKPGVTGVVRQVSPLVDSATLGATVYVDLPEPAWLRAGMFASGELQSGATRALHVPESALVFRDGFEYVMKVDSSNRVQRIKVSTGRRSGRAVEILGADLSVADRVVRSGGSFLDEGDTVRLSAASSEGAAAEAPSARAGAAR